MHRYPAIPPHTAQVIPLKNIICITVSGAILNKNTIIDDNIIVNIAVTSPNTIEIGDLEDIFLICVHYLVS